VVNVPPLFDDASRTLKVRLELDNPGYALKPGMFVDVEFPVTLPPAVTIPSEAVVDSGVRRTVFVDRGDGYFEPRRVETGWRMGDRVQIVSGLQPGEQIAISGTFLLDSESRMRNAAAGIITPETDPVCGMDVDREQAIQASRTATHKGATYYFCSDQCRKDFEKDPAKYVR
jgi:multidrug efflux pump subunit AcrA (membrane-fusion protein)/YHS domain-containing protein